MEWVWQISVRRDTTVAVPVLGQENGLSDFLKCHPALFICDYFIDLLISMIYFCSYCKLSGRK